MSVSSGVLSLHMEHDELKQLARMILDEGFLMSLGTTDGAGVWVSDVIYVHDDELSIYWVSLPSARHSKAIDAKGAVAGTITASWELGKERALQFSGTAQRLEGAHLDLERALEAKRGKEVPKVAGEILSRGHEWYVLKPTAIKVIDGVRFGYERKSLDLSA